MLEIWFYSLASVLVVSLVALIGLPIFLLKQPYLKRVVLILVGLSVGALFGDAFIHLIPEVLSGTDSPLVSILIVVGILIFFILEKTVKWHHSHYGHETESEHCPDCLDTAGQKKPFGVMILLGDGLHNFIDGLVIAVSYLAGVEIGLATTLAVILHEIPQEIGDLGLLLHAGYSKARALFFNFLSALLAIAGVIVGLIITTGAERLAQYIMAVAAGGFVYIAGSDLVPELHKTLGRKESFLQVLAIVAGVIMMLLLLLLGA